MLPDQLASVKSNAGSLPLSLCGIGPAGQTLHMCDAQVTPKWDPSETHMTPRAIQSHCGSTTFICVVVLCEQNRNNNIGFACYSTPYASPLQWLVSKLQQQQKTTVTVFLVREIYRKTSILTNCQPQRQDWPRLEKKTMKMMNTTLLLYITDPDRLRQSQCWCKQVV